MGQTVHFDGSGSSDPDPGDTLRYAWSFDDGASASTATVPHAFTTPGTHTVHLTVTDPTGLTASAAASVTAVVTAAHLELTAVTESRSRWALGSRRPTIARKNPAKPPVGTFGFTLNAAATVRFVFTHATAGRVASAHTQKCVAPTRANRHRPRCTRIVTDGALSFHAHAGHGRLHFEGRLDARRTLKPGAYTVIVSAVDSAGKATLPRILTFTIVNDRKRRH